VVRSGNLLIGRGTTEFQSHADILADLLLQRLQLPLRVHELPRDFVLEQGFPRRLELADLHRAQLNASPLLVIQLLAALVHALVLQPRRIIAQEALHLPLPAQKLGVGGNFLAKLTGLRNHGSLFSNQCHVDSISPDPPACNADFAENPPAGRSPSILP
jgi:hypothetical protein